VILEARMVRGSSEPAMNAAPWFSGEMEGKTELYN